MTRPLALRAGSVARGPVSPCCCASRLCSRSISSSRTRVAGGTSEPCFRSHSAHLGRRLSLMWPRKRTREAKKYRRRGKRSSGQTCETQNELRACSACGWRGPVPTGTWLCRRNTRMQGHVLTGEGLRAKIVDQGSSRKNAETAQHETKGTHRQ